MRLHRNTETQRSKTVRRAGRCCRRGGLTMLEVVLAISIFLGSMAVLGQLISTGSRAAVESGLESQAALLCETKLAEVVSGVEPLQQVNSAPLDNSGEWVWNLEYAEDTPIEDLVDLQVTVAHIGAGGEVDARVSIRRYFRNPLLWQEAADEAAAAAGIMEALP